MEDKYNWNGHPGQDWWTVDDSIGQFLFVFYTSHGWLSGGTGYGTYYFRGATCGIYGRNEWDNYYMVLGERYGSNSTPWPGCTRWLVLNTCHSLEIDSTGWMIAEWHQVTNQDHGNLGAILGFDNDNWIGYTTDEVGYDLADRTIGAGWSLKSAWFYAVYDWYADNIGVMLAWSNNIDDALYMLNYQWVLTGSAVPWGNVHAYSWIEG